VKKNEKSSSFYLKAYVTEPVNIEWQHRADNRKVQFHVTEEGIVKNRDNIPLGTFTLNVVAEILDLEALTGTMTAKYVINYYTGETISGTITGKVQNAVLPDVKFDGKFVGHGYMNVMGEASMINEGTHDSPIMVLVLDGYSW
jgi:hypothetical protein